MIHIQNSVLKIDLEHEASYMFTRIQDLIKKIYPLRKKIEILNDRHIRHIQDEENEIQEPQKEIEVLNALIKWYQNQFTSGKR